MATAKQIEANRRNARKCTGPKTEEGKARASQNALQSGVYAESEVIGSESRDGYNALIAEYHDHFAPATPQERSLVDALIRYEWLSRRYMAADAAVWNLAFLDGNVPQLGVVYLHHSQTLARATRAFQTARQGYTATLKELESIQAKRKAEEPAADAQPEPKQSTQLDPKLVSFRHPPVAPDPEPQPLVRTAQQAAEIPPLAA